MLLADLKDGIHIGDFPAGNHAFDEVGYLCGVYHGEDCTLCMVLSRSINKKYDRIKKEPKMAYDTDNNVIVSGFSGEAIIATDYVATESNHFQVVKLAYGTAGVTGSATRVTSGSPLPVTILGNPTVAVSAITNPVTVTGTVSVNQPVGVTASDLDIRSLTAGDPSTGLATGADFVRVVGLSGAWPVGVTATNFGIRALTAGDPTTAGAAGQDTIRIVGYSGGWPIGVTAVDLDIRSLTYGSDSVSVLNTVNIDYTVDSPYSVSITDGFQSRLLRASPYATPYTSQGNLSTHVLNNGYVEDTVRVVGLSGAWPVSTFMHGLTSINNYDTKLPLLVDSTGALAVYLAAGSISVTAEVGGISSLGVTLNGISIAYPSGLSNTLPIRGYTGSDTVPVAVTGSVDIMGSGLTYLTNISNNTMRVLGASGDYVGVTGDIRDKINQIEFADPFKSGNSVKTFDAYSPLMYTTLNLLQTSVGGLGSVFSPSLPSAQTTINNDTTNGPLVKVDVRKISQPDGVTSGTLTVSDSATTNLSGSSIGNLKSGVHLKARLTNTGTIYVGTNSASMSSAASHGFPLYAGDQLFVETDSLTKLFYRADTAGNTLHYFAT